MKYFGEGLSEIHKELNGIIRKIFGERRTWQEYY